MSQLRDRQLCQKDVGGEDFWDTSLDRVSEKTLGQRQHVPEGWEAECEAE